MSRSALAPEPKVTCQDTKTCPRCGSKDLLRQARPGGQIELICLDLDCSFTQLLPARPPESKDPFADHLAALTTPQLQEMAQTLDRTSRTLTARPRRLARQQLALVTAELRRRGQSPTTSDLTTPAAKDTSPHSADPAGPPSQFLTPRAAENRIRGIREHYRQRRQLASASASRGHWLRTFLETLHDEAARHEQAARTYARGPETLPLHIEYTAKAAELRRIIDRLTPFAIPEDPL